MKEDSATTIAARLPGLLDYAPARRRRRKLVWLAIVGFLGVLAAGAWRWGPAALHRAQVVYWQGKCLRYVAPSNQAISKWQAPACWTGLESLASSTSPGAWGPPAKAAVAFLHERRSPSGTSYLVCIRFDSSSGNGVFIHGGLKLGVMEMYSNVAVPATLTNLPVPVPQPQRNPDRMPGSNDHRVVPTPQIFAGQPDPNDPSHFTIQYQMWGQSDTVDGYIDNNGIVTLTQRSPPTRRD